MPTLGHTLKERGTSTADAERPYLLFEDEVFTHAEVLRESRRYAHLFLRHRPGRGPFHVGLLLQNRPEFVFAELGAALAGATVVGLNPTRRGSPLNRDIGFSDCALVLTEPRFERLLAEALDAGSESPARPDEVWITSSRDPERASESAFRPVEPALAALGPEAGETDPDVEVADQDAFLILFTSGTTQAPKGVLRSHGALALMGLGAGMTWVEATPDDVVYTAMPLFHANAQILGLSLSLACGTRWALARSFHKSGFLSDVRRHRATLFHYVGSPLAYIMDTPEKDDDATNPLRLAFGNEAPRQYIEAFATRFGCRVSDSYGASEVGVSFTRQDGDPPSSLGRAADGVKILDEDNCECAIAELDEVGRLRNAEDAIGEIVNTTGRGLFEGYYKNASATEERTRGNRYYTGDLGYRDADGFIYFAGRSAEWLRVQGENFLARPIEQILIRHPDVVLAAVYAVPDPEAGDRVMAAMVLRDGAAADLDWLPEFLDRQPDLSRQWRPTFVRITRDLPRTETNKILKRELQRHGFPLSEVGDPIWWTERGQDGYERFGPDEERAFLDRFRAAGTMGRLEP